MPNDGKQRVRNAARAALELKQDVVKKNQPCCRNKLKMFRKNTVFIVGAGASAEYRMPIGAELKQQIAEHLNFEEPTRDSEFFEIIINKFGKDAERYQRAAVDLSRLIGEFDSIDEALHWFSGRRETLIVGKAAIVREILHAERRSQLFDAVNPEMAREEDYGQTWLSPFLQMAVGSLSREETVENLFKNVVVINFNYDRVIEHFIVSDLQRRYKFSATDAQTFTSNLKIIRPYGRVAPLAWQDGEGLVFGADLRTLDDNKLFSISENIFTYTEKNLAKATDIQAAIASARLIVFLGFGFHQQNMDLLLQPTMSNARWVLGTNFQGKPENNKALIPYVAATVSCPPDQVQLLDRYAHSLLNDMKPSIIALTS
jgi:hypothetical protein